MHKFAILLIGILSVVLFGEEEHTQSIYTCVSEVNIDRAEETQWQCERRSNSDLILTRILCEVVAPSSTLLSHSHRSEWGKEWHRANIRLENEYSERIKKTYNYSILSAVVRVADRYIYRLRRLII